MYYINILHMLQNKCLNIKKTASNMLFISNKSKSVNPSQKVVLRKYNSGSQQQETHSSNRSLRVR